ncbi:hypothetical protein FHT17_004840 [Novosphingobium sp. SG916]|nr:hypothetical protein [Novosphingobium sp. SG919]NMN89907.1 hypothetical protein [Novosphingobium sp. SG916]
MREDVLLYRSFPQRGKKGWFQSPVCPPFCVQWEDTRWVAVRQEMAVFSHLAIL